MQISVDAEYDQFFDLVDKDADKMLTRAEFLQIIEKMGAHNSKKIGEKLLKACNAGDKITPAQFKQAFHEGLVMEHKKQDILSAFEMFDAGKTGTLKEIEVRIIFTQMGTYLEGPELNDLISYLKPDKDGNCNYRNLVDRMFETCPEKK